MPKESRSFQPDPSASDDSERGMRDLFGEGRADIPPGADQYDFDGRDNPEEDGGEPSMGAQHGETHTRRPHGLEADRGHGPRTRARHKEILRGRL